MAATQTTFGDLSLALAQAITYLTRALISRYSATTIIKLQLALENNLKAQFESSWVPTDPLRGSGRRCLTLAPSGTPPRPIYMACKSAGVEWPVWASLLGNVEFDLFVDPGCVSVRFGNWDTAGKAGKFFTIWSQDSVETKEAKAKKQSELELQAQLKAQAAAHVLAIPGKTFAQQLILQDANEDDELFTMLADEIREPTWITPIASQFPSIPAPPRSESSSPAASVSSSHSRSSSSSGFSFSSCGSTDSYGTATTVSRTSASGSPLSEKLAVKLSRREKARQAKVFVDASKTEVTNYDGGKTTVLTGGVMLGGAPKVAPKLSAVAASHRKTASSASDNWRRL